jgi:hypothetical protein
MINLSQLTETRFFKISGWRTHAQPALLNESLER